MLYYLRNTISDDMLAEVNRWIKSRKDVEIWTTTRERFVLSPSPALPIKYTSPYLGTAYIVHATRNDELLFTLTFGEVIMLAESQYQLLYDFK